MKTQISKKSVDAQKRYAGVYQQQGRMLTDADWNSLVDVLKAQLAEALQDVVGDGSPRNGALAITDDRRIRPGDLYVDGLRAALPGTMPFAASDQPDLPESGDLSATGPYVVYADVWERSLTALEDSELRDVALNGADTCTRTQTMLQVKTCPEGIDPEADIPQKGDAELSLDLHENLEASDPCDPCAGLVGAGQGRVGNYLFRLEVHAVTGDAGNPSVLTLKWSSENGAEQFVAQEEELMPPGFVNSRYLYEFYDLATEKHAGVHLTAGFSPRSGILKTAYAVPDGASDPKAYVRRWDGFCELRRSGGSWTLESGWDKGVDLSPDTSAGQPGHVVLGPGLTVNIEAFRMHLALSGKTVVAGDYWLAAVREAVHTAGSAVCSGALPDGIAHHYLRLAAVAADGSVTRDADDADRRRHAFPPLTDLHAHDIDYRPDCTQGLFLDFEGTVKEALDSICGIDAADVGFSTSCNAGIYEGVNVATVDDALKLLCEIQARQVAYKAGACAYLDQPGVETVQDALDALCQRPAGGGCKVTVGEDGQFPTIASAVEKSTAEGIFDICVCLLRGDHPLDRIEKAKAFPHLHLTVTGCGPGTRILPSEEAGFLGLDDLHLNDLWIDSLDHQLTVKIADCGTVALDRVRHIGMASEMPLLHVSGTAAFSMNDGELEAYVKQALERPAGIFAFNADVASLFTQPGRRAFLDAAAVEARKLAKLNAADRKKFAQELKAALETGPKISLNERLSYERLLEELVLSGTGRPHFLDALSDIRDQAHHAAAGHALVFEDAMARVSLLNTRIYGDVSLYGLPGDNLNEEEIKKLGDMLANPGQLTLVAQAADFVVQGTLLTRMALSDGRVKAIRQLLQAGKGALTDLHATTTISESIIAWNGNLLLSADITLNGDNLQSLHSTVGSVIGETVIYSANRVQRRVRNNEWVGGGRVLTAARDAEKAANMPAASW